MSALRASPRVSAKPLPRGIRVSAITSTDELVDHTTAMALEERAKLRKHFTRFDIYFFLICTIVGVDTLGLVASEGAQGFTWLIFLSIAFFVP